jgi:hypothetical protein
VDDEWMDKRIIEAATKMKAAGHSWDAIAEKTGTSARTLRRHVVVAKSWPKAGQKQDKSLAISAKDLDDLAEVLRLKLANDAHDSVEALRSWKAGQLDLQEFEKRERIAESIQKRATSLLNIGEKQEPVVNIALMSQLPDNPSLTTAKVYDVVSNVE